MSDLETYYRPINRIKILIVGDCNVGKTSMLTQYIQSSKRSLPSTHFSTNKYEPTIEGNIYKTRFLVNCKENILSIASVNGNNEEEIFIKTREHYYLLEKKVDVVLICFSLIDLTSYTNVTLKWLPEIKKYFKEASILLVGTKSDIKIDLKAKRFHDKFIHETSLFTNVDENFMNDSHLQAIEAIDKSSTKSSVFTFIPTPPLNISLNEQKNAYNEAKTSTNPPNSPLLAPPIKPLRSIIKQNNFNNRCLVSSLFNLHVNFNVSKEESVFDDEITVIERHDCLKLKTSIDALKYFECSSKDILSITTALNYAIIVGANLSLKRQKLLDDSIQSVDSFNKIKDDSFASFDYRQESSFISDGSMLRTLRNYYTKLNIIKRNSCSLNVEHCAKYESS